MCIHMEYNRKEHCRPPSAFLLLLWISLRNVEFLRLLHRSDILCLEPSIYSQVGVRVLIMFLYIVIEGVVGSVLAARDVVLPNAIRVAHDHCVYFRQRAGLVKRGS